MKKSLLSVLLMVLLTPWAIKAEELTVCDGAAGSSYVPFYGMYADTQGAASECIIPSDSLSDMAGGQISAMKFYISSSAAAAWTGTHQVYVGEVDQTTMTTIGGPGLYTVVKTAVFDATGSELTITFDAPYAYAGGNLLIGTYVSVAGNWKSATFAGVAQTENTGAYRNGASGSATGVKFLPKTTFTYTPGAAPTCDKPATVAVSDITNNSATVAWTGNSAAFNVEYKKASDQAWTPVLGSTSLLTTSLSGLAPLTSYVVRVQGVCGNDSSAWKSASFTTEAGVPLISDFSTGSIPTEWSRYSALLENVMKGSATLTPYTSGWGSGSANGVFGTEKHLKINIYGNSCNYWIVSPEIMMENNVQLSFDLALTKYSGTLSPVDKSQQDDDQFIVLITTDSGTSWQILRQWNNTGSPYVYNDITCSAAGEPVAIDLSSFSGQKIAIALYGESTVTGNGDNNLHVGNLKIDYIPSCFKPLSVVADNFTTTSARLGWLPAGSETDWMIQYKKVGGSVWTTIGANVNPFTLQNLEPATQYEVQMAAWCDTSDSTAVSEFTRPISFTTECDVISSFPWAEGFDSIAGTSSATSNNLPVCWKYINTSTYSSYAVYPIVYAGSSYAHSALNSLKFYSYAYYYSGSTSYDPQPQYAILPEMNGLDDKQLTLWAKGYSSSSAIKIGRMTNPADTSTFQLIAEQSLTTSYKEYTFNLSAATGNYVAIMIDAATPERSTNGAYVDDISIHEAPACAKPSALAVSEVTSHTAKLRWIAGFDETAWQIMLNGDAEHLIAADTNVFVLTNLPADSLIIAKVRANCGATQSEWASDSVIFRTQVACPAPVFKADSIKNIGAHSADIAWGGNSESYIISYRTSAYVDAAYAEDFESGIDEWTLVDCADGTGVTSNMFRFYYNTNPPQYLISPEMNGITEGLQLRFYYRAHSSNYEESFAVGFSTTDNSTSSFTFGPETFTTTTEWTLYTVDVPAGAKYFCIKYTANDKYYLYLDDITVGTEVPAGEWVVESGITANSKQLTGLAAETYYDVKIQGNCGDEGLSAETSILQFSTISDCETPAGLAADSITLTSAVISWETYGLTEFNLRYSADGENFQQILATAMPCKLTGLTASTAYTVQVQATCNTEDWSEPLIFKTAYGIPFAPEELDMTEWSKKAGLAANVFAGEPMVSQSGGWGICNANDAFEAQHLKINNYGTNCKAWILSPVIDATNIVLAEGEKLKLSFRLALAKYDYSGSVAQLPDTTGIDDKFIVAFAIDSCTTWLEANATIWNNADGNAIYNYIPNMGMDVNLDFSAAAGHMVQFAFYAESTVANADNDLHVGNIVLQVISNTTDIQAIEASDKAIKFVENGQIYIRFNGVTYDALGRLIRK